MNFGNGVTPVLLGNGKGFLFDDARYIFSPADVAFVNLECCIASSGFPAPGKEFTFRGPSTSAELLKLAGVDVVSVANNHALDYGKEAFLETTSHLKENGIFWCGGGRNAEEAYKPAIIERHGVRIAFVAFSRIMPNGWAATSKSPGCASGFDSRQIASAIKGAKANADFVVASFHWGVELATTPGEDQRELAHLAIDSGACMVIGHHPHVVQGFEVYRNSIVAYSLGNFVFSPPREISSRTLAVTALFSPSGLVQAKVVPMRIINCRPLILDGKEADLWLSTVAGYSKALGTKVDIRNGRGFIERLGN